jgi:23S rRNA (cytosine1962-C5)-methyltransferase
MITVTLKPGREGPVRAGHPWVFSGAIGNISAKEPAGSLAHVVTANGQMLGTGYLNPACSIAVRMLIRSAQATAITPAFIRSRLERALTLRQSLIPPNTTGYRLVNGEGDFLPGFVIDVYDRFVVLQCLTAGADALRSVVVEAVADLLSPHGIRGIYEKSEGKVRKEEGLVNRAGVIWGEEPPSIVEIQEHGHRFQVHIQGGQKTGFFLDQRENRALVGSLASGKSVLNGFSYTGGFGLYAAKQGAKSVISVDSAAPALRLAKANWQANGLTATPEAFIQADMFSYLRALEEKEKKGEKEEKFDIIILDPPPFIRRRQDVKAGLKGYKDINLHAISRLTSGGQLFTFSCSQHVSALDFMQAILFAAVDAKREVQILRTLGPAADHPVNIAHLEGAYLKGIWLRMGD